MSLDMRLMAYQPNGNLIGPLPACQRIQAMFSRTELGAIEFDYGRTAPLASTLDGDIEVAFEVSSNGSPYIEVTDGRFLILGSENDDAKKTDGVATLTGPSYGFRLAKAVVTKGNGTLKEGRRYFAPGSTAGGIMSILMSEAKSRGALAGVSFGSFSGTKDSDGKPWALGTSISYDPGLDLLSVVMNLIDQGMCTMRWVGREMFLYNADFGKDKTTLATPLVLRLGRDIFEAPERTDGTQQATVAYAKGDDGKLISASSAANPAPWGRWETTVNQGGVSSDETLSYLAQRTLEMSKGTKREAGRGMVFTEGSPLPFIDYAHSDWIYSDTGSGLERLRVHQITLMRDAEGVATGSIILNDAIRELDIAIARRVNGILGGATAGGGSPATPIPTAPTADSDKTIPLPPSGLAVTSDAYLEGGTPQAVATLSWTPPTANTDGSDLMDLFDYEVEVYDEARGKGTTYRTSESPFTAGGLRVGATYRFIMRSYDIYGHRSAKVFVSHTTAKDTTPPSVPSKPVVEVALGVVGVSHDGKAATGAGMESDFSHCELHRSKTSNFTPSTSTFVDRLTTGKWVAQQPYAETWYYRLVAVDYSGNKSAASAQSSAATTPVANTDLANEVIANIDKALADSGSAKGQIGDWTFTGKTTINGGKIEFDSASGQIIKANTIGVERLAVADTGNMATINEQVAGTANLATQAHVLKTHSDQSVWSAREPVTSPNFWFRPLTGPIPFRQGDRVRVTFMGKVPSGSVTPTCRLVAYDNAGAVKTTVTLTATAGSQTTMTTADRNFSYEGDIPALDPAITRFVVGLQDVANADVRIRDARAYRMGAGELIVDGSILAKHIKANEITADKLKAGFFQGLVIEGALIRTAATGGRWELSSGTDSNVLKAYTGDVKEIEPAQLLAQSLNGTLEIRGTKRTVAQPAKLQVGWDGSGAGGRNGLFGSAGTFSITASDAYTDGTSGYFDARIAAAGPGGGDQAKAELSALDKDGSNYLYLYSNRTVVGKPIKSGTYGDWMDALLGNGWTNFGVSWGTPAYRLLPDGRVELRGLIRPGSTGQIFTVYSDLLPKYPQIFYQPTSTGLARIDINSSGVSLNVATPYPVGTSPQWVSLAGLTYDRD